MSVMNIPLADSQKLKMLIVGKVGFSLVEKISNIFKYNSTAIPWIQMVNHGGDVLSHRFSPALT
jgi:hypothetical protein